MSIELNEVEFFYPNSSKKKVLDIEHWSVAAKEKCFLYGPSGSGKSTLLNIISGVMSPVSGDVMVLGEPLHKMSRRQRDKFRANNIGYVFQQFNLINYLNAVDNITLANHFSTNRSKGLSDNIATMLHALKVNEDDWFRPVNQLSIGQQQRIGIARALINQPKLLIADEPTSSLDSDARDSFMSLLTALCEESNATLLFVSHDRQLAPHFDRSQELNHINRLSGAS